MRPVRIFQLLALVSYCAGTYALAGEKCQLPVPDGSEERPSSANLTGRIYMVSGREVVIRQHGSGKLVKVRLSEPPEIYSAFGGYVKAEELAKGQMAQVWFRNCVWPSAGLPVSGYFQIYSKDPKDRP